MKTSTFRERATRIVTIIGNAAALIIWFWVVIQFAEILKIIFE